MKYQVLARKWRPKIFDELVGQEATVKALQHALSRNQLHHAYLFTGTHGVGKTTVARILAKSLNCETGITATPCGTCDACQAIDQGRYVDLLEIDAASRTKVEDTRDLLDNVQYLPSVGRFKIYLIDEVHMLSGHSFNALLKTLEEPPEHVKFLLATTDPQKLPVTVLSRCLQFHLKNLSIETIEKQLAHITDQDKINTEAKALHTLAKVANGSMRDALSLCDQAISFSDGLLTETDVNGMLGRVSDQTILDLLSVLASKDATALNQQCNELSSQGADFLQVLNSLLEQLHHLAIGQFVAGHAEKQTGLADFVSTFSKEDLQLYYQIGLMGKRDLSLAPTPRCGFEMTLLRMLAFTPGEMTAAPAPVATKQTPAPKAAAPPKTAPPVEKKTPEPIPTKVAAPQKAAAPSNDWQTVIAALNVDGMARSIVTHCQWVSFEGDTLTLAIDALHQALLSDKQHQHIQTALSEYYGKTIVLTIQAEEAGVDSPAKQREIAQKAKNDAAKAEFEADPMVQSLMSDFDAKLVSHEVNED